VTHKVHHTPLHCPLPERQNQKGASRARGCLRKREGERDREREREEREREETEREEREERQREKGR